jgi:hypothetical protein
VSRIRSVVHEQIFDHLDCLLKMIQQAGTAVAGAVEGQKPSSPSLTLFHFILTLATTPYRRTFKLYTWQPIRNIRAANGDRKLLIPLVRDWKVDKYDELQSVQVAVGRVLMF